MLRNASSFHRGAAKYKPQPLVLVLCEDTKSSKTYFQEAATHFRSIAKVEFAHCGRTDPLGVVQGAVHRSRNFDRVFCVIDRDSHDPQNFAGAMALTAASPKLTTLTSYPCFEFWLLLHFGFSRAPFMAAGKHSAADRVIQDLRTKDGMGAYSKGGIEGLFLQLLPKLDAACARASRTIRDAALDNESNPSTPLHELIDELRKLGTPASLN